MLRQFATGVTLAVLLAGCAGTSVIQTSATTLVVTTSAAPICGATGAQKVAYQSAAIATIKQGYDRFMIVGAEAQNNVRVVGTTPLTAQTYGTATVNGYGNMATINGSSNTYFTGGRPIMGGSHDQSFAINVFRNGDPGADQAIDARGVLGPEWAKVVAQPPQTCW